MLWIGIPSVIVLIIAIGAGWFWYSMGQPLYQPGMVRAGQNLRAGLTPPIQQATAAPWQVEPDIALQHVDVGTGRNVLIVHGGPGVPYAQAWPGLEPLIADYQFHYYDQRGAGGSTRPFERFTGRNYYQNMRTLERTLGIGAQVADIERIRQLLGEEQLIVIGHSWGGLLATLYAAEFPERVAALILVSPADMLVMPVRGDDLFATVRQRLPAALLAEYDAYMQDYLNFGALFTKSEADLQAANRAFGKYYQMATGAALPAAGEVGGWLVHAMYFSSGQRHDYRAALQRITAPVLVLHGAEDLQPVAASQHYVDGLPNAKLVTIANAGHFMFIEQPAAFAAQISEFLAAVPVRP